MLFGATRADAHQFASCEVRSTFVSELCHMTPETQDNTATYGDTSTHIDVAEVVESELRWWDLVCVSARGPIRFPSAILQTVGGGQLR